MLKDLLLERDASIFIKKLVKRIKIRRFVYGWSFWLFTLLTALFTLLTSLVSTARLAADNVKILSVINTIFRVSSEGGDEIKDLWPIIVIYMGLGTSLSTSLLGFFLVKNKAYEAAKMDNAITLELELYKQRLGKYAKVEREYELFKRVTQIANIANNYLARAKTKRG